MIAEQPLHAVLFDALRLRRGLCTNYAEDVRWLFQLRLWDWLAQQGYAVVRAHNDGTYLRREAIELRQDAPLVYPASGPRGTHVTLDAAFCQRYFGFGDYSYEALNYAHTQRASAQPSDYVADGPLSLGSFGVILNGRPAGDVPALPDALRTSVYARVPFRRTQSILAWLGVWFDGSALPRTWIEHVNVLPRIDHGWPRHKGRWFGSWSGRKVALHYDRLRQSEESVRRELGFAPLGKPVSEEILYRSVGEIFGDEAVLRRYRGRELQGLELDVWVPAMKLGFEYQGEQHTKHVPLWHGEDGLQRQRARDERKKLLCAQLGYRVLYFHPNDWLDRTSVLQRLRRENIVQPKFEPRETE